MGWPTHCGTPWSHALSSSSELSSTSCTNPQLPRWFGALSSRSCQSRAYSSHPPQEAGAPRQRGRGAVTSSGSLASTVARRSRIIGVGDLPTGRLSGISGGYVCIGAGRQGLPAVGVAYVPGSSGPCVRSALQPRRPVTLSSTRPTSRPRSVMVRAFSVMTCALLRILATCTARPIWDPSSI